MRTFPLKWPAYADRRPRHWWQFFAGRKYRPRSCEKRNLDRQEARPKLDCRFSWAIDSFPRSGWTLRQVIAVAPTPIHHPTLPNTDGANLYFSELAREPDMAELVELV